jgi:hypothetical protein
MLGRSNFHDRIYKLGNLWPISFTQRHGSKNPMPRGIPFLAADYYDKHDLRVLDFWSMMLIKTSPNL